MSAASLIQAERSLLSSTWLPQPEGAAQTPALELARLATEASYVDVLASDLAKHVLALGPAPARAPGANVADEGELDLGSRLTFDRAGNDEAEWELAVLSVAVALLQSYVQLNWTGPLLPIGALEVLDPKAFHAETTAQDLDQAAIGALSYLGEPAYHLAQNPTFLRLALLLLDQPFTRLSSSAWWLLRATRAHHQTLILNAPLPLPEAILPAATALLSAQSHGLDGAHILLPADQRDLRSKLALEIGLVYHLLLGSEKEAGTWFIRAARDEAGLEWELTGAMGKRTKFQQEDMSQLVVVARGRERKGWIPSKTRDDVGLTEGQDEEPSSSLKNDADASAATPSNEALVPENFKLNDDTLLETTAFTSSSSPHPTTPATSLLQSIDPSNHPPLHPVDQTHLLALPLIHAHQASDELSTSQLTPFTARILSSPQNWSIHTTALLLRSRAEAGRTRTVERSILQLQALVDQIPLNDDDPVHKGIAPARERLRYVWSLVVPTRWDLEKELAERLASLGVIRSSMEIYERLEMWDKVVICYQQLEQPEKALEVVRALLEGRLVEQARVLSLARKGEAAPSERHRTRMSVARKANLICSLGDILPDERLTHYKEAWEVSEHTSSRAARCIAGALYANGDTKASIPYFEAALAINPLFGRSWFVLGCAYVKEEAWRDAVRCFRRVVAIDEEDAEGWANLASCYLRMGDIGDEANLKKEAAGIELDDVEVEEEPAVVPEVDALKSDRPRIPHANKILAHRALKIGLKAGHENWRMWSNYILVSIDLGENTEALRALTRVIELRASKDGARCIDPEVLNRLVLACTSFPSPGEEQPDSATSTSNLGVGLLPHLTRLFEQTLLPRISDDPHVWSTYARLLLWQGGALGRSLDCNIRAYRASVSSDETVERDVARWREAVDETVEVVEALQAKGPRAHEEEIATLAEGEKPRWKDWKFQARSLVRTFMGRTKDAFGDEPEWDKLKDLLDELKGSA